MSELIQKNDNRTTIRWKLLTSASALALTYISSTGLVRAEDADRPLIWLEFSGDTELLQGTSGTFTAPFFDYPSNALDALLSNDVTVVGDKSVYGSKSFSQKQAPPRFAFGGDAKLAFQPEDSDWTFSAELRYGRSHGQQHTHYQGPPVYRPAGTLEVPKYAAAFSDTKTQHSEQHLIADFEAGRDVGLGVFGQDGSSKLGAGIRIAQFSNSSSVHVSARPFVYVTRIFPIFNQYFLEGHQARSFKGIGPEVSWEASAALAGNHENGELTLDWGISGALLFGRQKAKTSHATTAYQLNAKYNTPTPLYPARNIDDPARSRRVTVPELGGFVGLSARLPHSKISIGYKGDIWFNAMDTGIDARKTSNLTFNGPYASISIGLGD